MRFRNFVKAFLLLFPVFSALVVLISILWIRYADPGLTDTRLHGLGYNTLAHHRFTRACCAEDVVLVGDSSLLLGVVPSVLEKRLDRRVINLGLYATSGLPSCTLLVDHYLQRNRRPECLVFYFLASTPYYFDEHSYEKSYTLLKYGDPWAALSRPDQVDFADCVWAARDMARALSRNALSLSRTKASFGSDLAALEAQKGFVRTRFGAPLPQEYRFTTRQEKELDLRYIAELKRRYQPLGIRVLYCVAPLAQGDLGFPFFKNAYRDIDNTITTLPNRYFADQRHLTEPGARYNSEIFAGYLAEKLAPRQARFRTGPASSPLTASK